MRTSARTLGRLIKRLALDDHGGEVIEYVLIAGLIVAATIATVAAFGTKVFAKWTSINRSF